MYKGHKIAAVVPAYNEELLLPETIRGMPEYIDKIIIIDDCSRDNTYELILKMSESDSRLILIKHEVNQGLGQSLIDGYVCSLGLDIDITVVMAGDNQMNPNDLPSLLDKITIDNYDYVKGNRLLHKNIKAMPTYRYFGNAILTILTKFATGYYFSMDPQCGYTAIKNKVLSKIPITSMIKGYGYNADILCMLNIQGFSVADVEVEPIYDREKSKIKLWKYVPTTSCLLIKLFLKRIWQRYVILDFHPLVFFYFFAFFNTIFILIPGTVRFFYLYFYKNEFPSTTFIILSTTFLTTIQLLLFAIWLDMDYNKNTKRKYKRGNYKLNI
jgi:glycosyltransferase involved in cell wall biosynthesis